VPVIVRYKSINKEKDEEKRKENLANSYLLCAVAAVVGLVSVKKRQKQYNIKLQIKLKAYYG